MPASPTDVLVLDAMGVIFAVGHDVRGLLAPFVREKGGCDDLDRVEQAYFEASLGRITPDEFWQRVGLSPRFEEECLARHELSEGIFDLLRQAPTRFARVVCLSNDVSQWSRKLRRMFELEPYFAAWYISGDLGLRKPDPKIYAHVLGQLGVEPERLLFVDDRTRNLDPARDIGIRTVHYNPKEPGDGRAHRTLDHLTELLTL